MPGLVKRWADGLGRHVPLALFVVACALILPNLGDRPLWQDEAETALVAKNILRTGLPLGWDGRLFVTQLSGAEMTSSFLWAWTPWLMHYVAALGMAVAGETAIGARWPFALAGCRSFPLFHAVAVRVTRDRALALVELHAVRSWLAWTLGGLCVFTNLLVAPLPALLPTELWRSAFSAKLETGAEAIASFIEANTAPDDLIFMTNEALSSMFHTGRRFAGVAAPSIRNVPRFAGLPSYGWDATQARWFILRPSGAKVDDVKWINRELVSEHVFRPRDDRAGRIEVLRVSGPAR
jgi:hypothetical protein